MSMPEWITKNIELKGLALLLALLLWLNITPGREGELDLTIPVKVINSPSHLHIDTITPTAVRLRVSGPGFLLREIDRGGIALTLDAQGVEDGTLAFTGLDKAVSLPAGVHVIRLSPATVIVRISKKNAPLVRP